MAKKKKYPRLENGVMVRDPNPPDKPPKVLDIKKAIATPSGAKTKHNITRAEAGVVMGKPAKKKKEKTYWGPGA